MKDMDLFNSAFKADKNNLIYSMNPTEGAVTSSMLGTSKGVLLKWDYNRNGTHYYIKAGKSNGIYLGNLEPIAENISYKLGKLLGLNMVATGLIEYAIPEGYHNLKAQDCLLSYSIDFKTSTHNVFIPAIDLVDITKFSYNEIGDTLELFRDEINKMLVFDFIIGNYDRHLNNFGVLTSDESTDVIFAPIFDNGSSLLSNFNDMELLEISPKEVDNYSIAKPFGRTQFDQIKLIKELPKLNYEISSEEISEIVNEYACDLKPYRIKRIINLIERRLHYVRKIYHKE